MLCPKSNNFISLKVALYSFFGARGIGTNGASARVFKGKVKTKVLSFLSRTSVYQKTLKIVFKNTLISSSPDMVKLRSQFALLIAPTEREDSRDRTRKKSQSGHGVLFMVGGFAFSSLGDETPKTAGMSAKAQLTPEKQPSLRDKKGRFSRKEPTRRGNTDDRTRGIKEWRAKRKLQFQEMVEDWSPPKKRQTRLSQVWFKILFSVYMTPSNSPKSFKTSASSRLSLL